MNRTRGDAELCMQRQYITDTAFTITNVQVVSTHQRSGRLAIGGSLERGEEFGAASVSQCDSSKKRERMKLYSIRERMMLYMV